MPFTPFHFGPHAAVALLLRRCIDLPVFIGANVAVDIEPFLVMAFNLNYPLHGYCHTFLFGGLLGFAWGSVAYPLRGLIGKASAALRLPYAPTFRKAVVSGVLGVWLHILFDSPIYHEMKPLYPSAANPFLDMLEMGTVYVVCALCFIPALVMLHMTATRRRGASEAGEPPPGLSR